MKVIDLFCGIGGLGLGVVRAGFDLALSVDNDPILLEMHRLNFPRFSHLNENVANLTGERLLHEAGVGPGHLTGLIGGPPCQGFSHAGKRRHDDPRNELFIQFFRLVAETTPAFFVAENVPGILDPHNQNLVSKALAQVADRYTVLPPMRLNAADFGAATVRKRVLFVGYDCKRMKEFSVTDFGRRKWRRKTTVGFALRGLPKELPKGWTLDEVAWHRVQPPQRGVRFWKKIVADMPDGVGDQATISKFENGFVSGCIATNHARSVQSRFSNVPPGGVDLTSRAIRLSRQGLCPTLRAGTGPDRGSFQALRPIHFSEPRMITPREAARLQGFPDWFRFHATKWHTFRGIGNSVSPLLAEAVMTVLAQKLRM